MRERKMMMRMHTVELSHSNAKTILHKICINTIFSHQNCFIAT